MGQSSVQSKSHSPSFKWDWVSQVTVNTARRTERCMYHLYDGTSSAVHTSTAARVLFSPSSSLMAVHKAASPTRTLSHNLLRAYATSSPGLWAKCLRCVAGTLSMHTTAHVYETQMAIPSEIFFLQTNTQKRNGSCAMAIANFSFLVWASNYGRNWLAPPRRFVVVAVRF